MFTSRRIKKFYVCLKATLVVSAIVSLFLVYFLELSQNSSTARKTIGLVYSKLHEHSAVFAHRNLSISEDQETGRIQYEGKYYFCTDLRPDHELNDKAQQSPNDKCLGGLQSWGTCDNGFFLCESGIGPALTSLEPSTWRRCTDDTTLPFKYECIERVCMVSWFRYDPLHNSRFYHNHGIILSCYAQPRTVWAGSGSSMHVCVDPSKSFSPSLEGTESTDKPLVYIPNFSPLNSLVLGTDTAPPNKFPIKLVGLTAKPTSKCARTVTTVAILTSLDEFNPYHNLIMLYRRLFAATASFSVNAGLAGGMTNCTFAVWRGRPGEKDYASFTGFDWNFFSSLCRGGVLQLSPRSAPVCFASILVGATPGGWDMDIGPKRRTVGVNFAGVVMARWLRDRQGATGGEVRGAVMVVRRGRREMVNEAEVNAAISSAIAPAPLDVINFDRVNYTFAVRVLSQRAAMVGVHGAALCNLIFLPPGAALVEISISEETIYFYYHLALSFGKLYFEHAALVPMDEHLPELRDRRVNVSDLPALSRLTAHAIALVQARDPSCC